MSRRLVVRPDVEFDIEDSATWYDTQNDRLGDQFILEFETLLGRIVQNPEQYQIVESDVRKAMLKRFPYAIYYVVSDDELTILGCLHAHLHPRAWRKRIG